MIRKKAKKKSATKTALKKRAAQKKQLDPGQVREEIAGMVKSGAMEITEAVMDQAMHGELAPAKYLFEMAKIYPTPNDGEQATPEEDCLAKTLLARLDAAKKPAPPQDSDEADEERETVGGDAEPRKPEESENPNPAIP